MSNQRCTRCSKAVQLSAMLCQDCRIKELTNICNKLYRKNKKLKKKLKRFSEDVKSLVYNPYSINLKNSDIPPICLNETINIRKPSLILHLKKYQNIYRLPEIEKLEYPNFKRKV